MTDLKNLVNISKILPYDDQRNKVMCELFPTLKYVPSLNDLFTFLIPTFTYDDGKNKLLANFIHQHEVKYTMDDLALYTSYFTYDAGRDACLKTLFQLSKIDKLTVDEYNKLSQHYSFESGYLKSLLTDKSLIESKKRKASESFNTSKRVSIVMSTPEFSVLDTTKVKYKQYKNFPCLTTILNLSAGGACYTGGVKRGNIVKTFAPSGTLDIFKTEIYVDVPSIINDVIYYGYVALKISDGLKFVKDGDQIILEHTSAPNKLLLEFEEGAPPL